MDNRAEKILVLILRAVGSLELLALFPAVMPRSWMALAHELLGFGTFPNGPIPEYLARSLSGMYAFHGGLMLLAAADVHRRAWAVTYAAAAAVLAGLGLLVVDLSVGMPWWWTLGEGPFLVTFGLALLVLQRRVRSESAPSSR